MRRVTRNGVIAVAAASGAMAVAMPAYADSGANGTAVGSPGGISGNTIQLPVHVPVNACGNTVNVIGLLNPAAGNTCVSKGEGAGRHKGRAPSGATAESDAKNSPGLVSGNGLELPVDLPVNVSGNSVNVVGVGNPVFGNQSVNSPEGRPVVPERPRTPERPEKPTPEPPKEHTPHQPPAHEPHGPAPVLAHTGADHTVPAVAGAAALVLGGALLYRRGRPGALR
ncbi:LPXTG-motif cell wall anchor domain-containing protein [Streptomyces sp. DI166]|uniref:chaplin n=1 Tax=Streptomyces sp. DI166 TaxID=1839783 RepID=UPI0007F379D9|nr:chaplin [Streptomyces sp. DI166]SBT91109.1 LPXTG-motif cell wall anchor domain-containing protein [Streptomyces sp. DI166]